MIGVRDYKLIYILYRVFGSKLINPIVQPHVDPFVVEPAILEGDSHVREEPKPLGKRMLREMRDLAEAANLREHPVSVVGCLHGLSMFIP